MKIGDSDRYTPFETALKEAGFKIDEIEKQDKKTVITVSQCGQAGENPDSPTLKAVPTV
jgi:hypothetical protein